MNSSLTLTFGAGYPSFWLRGTHQNNSLVTLEDIGNDQDGLCCMTCCCCSPSISNWFYPNGTKVPSEIVEWDFYHRGYSYSTTIYMHRRRGGVNGIYRCMIPDTRNVTQNIYIGVYTATTGELYM